MAHNITERDGLFTVRQPAWHGLGQVLSDYPTRAEAQSIAHPWEPVTESLFRRVPVIGEDGNLTHRFDEVPDAKAVVRSDNDEVLGAVSDTLEVVKNEVMYDIAEAIEGEAHGSVMYETGGSLKGGRKVWLLIRLREPIVVNGDPHGAVIPYYALQNAHDGTGAFRGQATLTRIVCDNTSQMADLDAQARGTEFVFRHTKTVHDRIDEAKQALAGWRESIENFRRLSEHLMAMDVSEAGAQQFVEQFIPMPKPGTSSDRVENNVREAQGELWTILNSVTCEGIDRTAYGLLQASVEYVEHARKARTNETRFRRAYLDRNRLIADATELAQTAALV